MTGNKENGGTSSVSSPDGRDGARPSSVQSPEPGKKPIPLSWVLIVILVYITLQTAYFLFFSE